MMINKLYIFAIILLVAWCVKINLDLYQLKNQQVLLMQNELQKQERNISSLQDKLILIQKQPNIENTPKNENVIQQNKTQITADIYYEQYVLDQLMLIQVNIDGQYIEKALEQLQVLRHRLTESPLLSTSVNEAVIEALLQDQNQLIAYSKKRNEHSLNLQRQLQKIEKELAPIDVDHVQNKWSVGSWFSFGKANNIPDFKNRKLYYKELQLQLLLAHQALNSGQTSFYLQQINMIIDDLKGYPDQHTQEIIKDLQKLTVMALPRSPKLSALALVQEH